MSDAVAFRRMEPAGAERHRREARRPSEREGANQTPYNYFAASAPMGTDRGPSISFGAPGWLNRRSPGGC